METLKTLRRRIRSIKSTRQITRAMEMVSAAKLRRAEMKWRAGNPYYETMRQMVLHLLFTGEEPKALEIDHPFLQQERDGADCLVVITSDRGLCGAFNTNIINRSEDFIRGHKEKNDVVLYCIGRRGYSYFNRRGEVIVGAVLDLGAQFDPEIAEKVAQDLESIYFEKNISDMHLLYSRFVSRLHQYPYCERLLPFTKESLVDKDTSEKEMRYLDYIIEPDFESLVDKLLPAFLRATITASLMEAFTSEHSARMIAMTNATRNCQDLVESLTLKMNKARQASITRELLDIVGGAEAFR